LAGWVGRGKREATRDERNREYLEDGLSFQQPFEHWRRWVMSFINKSWQPAAAELKKPKKLKNYLWKTWLAMNPTTSR
jgi:hypothetical protein